MDYDTLTERFNTLIGRAKRTERVNGAKPKAVVPTPEAIRSETLGEWAQEKEAATLVAWLDGRIEDARLNAHRLVGSPEGNWWLGHEAGLRVTKDEMLRLRGQPAGTPPARPA